MYIKKQREEGTDMKSGTKSENAAPVKKAEAEISTSVAKAASEKSVPAPKAPVSLYKKSFCNNISRSNILGFRNTPLSSCHSFAMHDSFSGSSS